MTWPFSGATTGPLDAGSVAALTVHRAQLAADCADWDEAWHDAGLVFVYEDGRDAAKGVRDPPLPAPRQGRGLPVIRFHGLRHTSASLALTAGVAMKVVSDRLGHCSTGITADCYTHVSPAVAGNAADAIAALIPRRPKPAEADAEPAAPEAEHRPRRRPRTARRDIKRSAAGPVTGV